VIRPMNSSSILRAIATAGFFASTLLGDSVPSPDTLDRYLANSRVACRAEEQAVEMEIQASLPKLKKEGTMQGMKVISASGQVAYRFLRFTGDKLIKTDVIGRFLTAEAQPPERFGNVAITRENYKFHYLRTADYNNSPAYVYQLKPRKKRTGLFKGELWLDATTAAPLRESGELVKSPSIFVQHFRFVRDYPEHAFCGAPQRTSITVQTRIVGSAEMIVLQHPVPGTWQPAEVSPVSAGSTSDPDGGNGR